jgi:hypothetical protein
MIHKKSKNGANKILDMIKKDIKLKAKELHVQNLIKKSPEQNKLDTKNKNFAKYSTLYQNFTNKQGI